MSAVPSVPLKLPPVHDGHELNFQFLLLAGVPRQPIVGKIGEIDERENDDGHGDDNGSDLFEEHPDPVDSLAQHAIGRRKMVDGQFNDEWGGPFAAQQRHREEFGHNQAHEQRHRSHEEHGRTSMRAEEGADQQQIEGTLARQFIMGTMRMVAMRALSSGMARVAMTPGMAQPPT